MKFLRKHIPDWFIHIFICDYECVVIRMINRKTCRYCGNKKYEINSL